MPRGGRYGSRIGVFGGSFNPPHLAHLVVAESAREEFELDEVLWVLSPRPPHKGSHTLAPEADRLAMVACAIAGNPHFCVSDLEIKRDGPSYTIDTLRTLQEQKPDADLFLIIGEDSLADFDSWREPSAILDVARLIVYRRGGKGSIEGIDRPERILFSASPRIDLSSSDIRHRIGAGMSIRYLVPENVREYIAERGLYGFRVPGNE